MTIMPAAELPRESLERAQGVAQPAPAEQSNTEISREGPDNWLSRAWRSVFGLKPGSIRADLATVLEAGAHGETGFTPEEQTLLRNILRLRERRVADVMIPRADIISVQKEISLGELVSVFQGAGHSRLVVYDDTLDDPIGMVHIRDLVSYLADRVGLNQAVATGKTELVPAKLDLAAIDLSATLAGAEITRPILFVPPSMPAIDLLAKMQATRIHLALVIDEYGGTDGLVSIEDIVEQIVGEIEDEHDENSPPDIVRQPDGSFLADARASLEEVTATIGAAFDVGEAAEDVDTLGGYLVMRAGRVPVRGELIPGPKDFEIEVLDADPRRVKTARIYIKATRHSDRQRDARRREPRIDASAGSPPTAQSAPRAEPPAAEKPLSGAERRP